MAKLILLACLFLAVSSELVSSSSSHLHHDQGLLIPLNSNLSVLFSKLIL